MQQIINVGKENAIFQEIMSLKENRTKRQNKKKFFVEGIQNIKDALNNGWQFECFIFCDFNKLSQWSKNLLMSVKNVKLYNFCPELMRKMSDKDDICELLAVVNMRDEIYKIDGENPIILLLDRPSKKGNLGTILRTADAFKVNQILISGHSVDIYDKEVIGASMGSFFKMNIKHLSSNDEFLTILNQLKNKYNDIQVIATSLQGDNYIKDINFNYPTILLIGNETSGLCTFYNMVADKLVKIPMNDGIDSLNIACATSIFLYEAYSQKIKK